MKRLRHIHTHTHTGATFAPTRTVTVGPSRSARGKLVTGACDPLVGVGLPSATLALDEDATVTALTDPSCSDTYSYRWELATSASGPWSETPLREAGVTSLDRRTLALPAGALPAGEHFLRLVMTAETSDGDGNTALVEFSEVTPIRVAAPSARKLVVRGGASRLVARDRGTTLR